MSQSNAKRGGKGAVGRYNTVQPMCSCNIYWSIILCSKLSDKFAKLSSSTTASTGRKNRKTAVVSNQKSNRNTQSNAKRGLAEKKMNVKGSAGAKPQGRRGGKGGWIALYSLLIMSLQLMNFVFVQAINWPRSETVVKNNKPRHLMIWTWRWTHVSPKNMTNK